MRIVGVAQSATITSSVIGPVVTTATAPGMDAVCRDTRASDAAGSNAGRGGAPAIGVVPDEHAAGVPSTGAAVDDEFAPP